MAKYMGEYRGWDITSQQNLVWKVWQARKAGRKLTAGTYKGICTEIDAAESRPEQKPMDEFKSAYRKAREKKAARKAERKRWGVR